MPERQSSFTFSLMEWHKYHSRELPWKKNRDPYTIWISEVILQQTRVDQGLPYFNRFLHAFPDVHSLANASQDDIMKVWEGLGYYSRARNLHAAARYIVHDLGGVFPKTYKEILHLKGVGEYTAAAISSFAYSLPYAVVDGNVVRVISRFLGIAEPVDSTPVKKVIKKAAQAFLEKDHPGDFNQAIMDLGATVCTPRSPDCSNCPLSADCESFANGTTEIIPVKSKHVKVQNRTMNYHILYNDLFVLIRKRNDNDIWRGLYDFYPGEEGVKWNKGPLSSFPDIDDSLSGVEYEKCTGPVTHQLTHRKIVARFYFYKAEFSTGKATTFNPPYYLVERKKLSTFAFPGLIKKHIIDKMAFE